MTTASDLRFSQHSDDAAAASEDARSAAPAPCGHPGCESRAGLRMTPWRTRVLDLLRAQNRALGAYELLDLIAREDGKAPAPISVYRALDGLLEAGLAHRLASRNAYLACGRSHCAAESVAFLICEGCGDIAEVASGALRGDLGSLAAGQGFAARAETIEILGRCARCRAAG